MNGITYQSSFDTASYLPNANGKKMIYETLEIIKDQVSNYLEAQTSDSNLIVLENIAKLDDPDLNTMNDKVVLSLINLDEEVTLKNHPNVRFNNGETVYRNKPVNLNIYVLFSANRTGYSQSLIALSYVIQFFQSKNVFTQVNTPLNPTITALDDIKEFKFVVELYTPTFEQLNYIWGTLGGKSVPSVMYKVSLLKIEAGNITDKGKAISEMTKTFNNI